MNARVDHVDRAAARLVAIGFDGPTPTSEARALVDRGVRSVILFTRNAGPRDQVASTIAAIKALSDEPILVCVDQEGGRTVRFTDGFMPPPPMREVGRGEEAAARIGDDLARLGRWGSTSISPPWSTSTATREPGDRESSVRP